MVRLRTLTVVGAVVPGLALLGFAASARQTVPPPKKSGAVKVVSGIAPVSFRESVEPYFKAHCTTCHSNTTASSGLNLENVGKMRAGGTQWGAKVIVPGKAAQSDLIAYLRGTHQPRMPMGGEPASNAQIKTIANWINQGAKIDTVKIGWPYVPPAAGKIPTVKNAAWSQNPIDRFVWAKLQAKGLTPAPPAGKIALLRRVYADLIGTPPSLDEAQQFLSDPAPDAYPKLVDRLLADPRYGERWGRHWLDLVRYADTDGFEHDEERPRAWRYRDYVIRAFNEDKPYDRFVKEQIAGDELYPDDPDAITATGYIRLGTWDGLSTDPAQRWQDYLNDATDTTGSVMLGLTVGCARCHNHKYDRISQADYYSMQAFFSQTQRVDRDLPHEGNDAPERKQKTAEARIQLQTLRPQLTALETRHRDALLTAKRKSAKPNEKVEVSDDDLNRSFDDGDKRDREERDRLRETIERWQTQETANAPVAEVVQDDPKPAPHHLLLRGSLLTPGPVVQPRVVTALNHDIETPTPVSPIAGQNGRPASTGRRTALANWIASPDNPMTARVIVNRLWQHHFGKGIVATPSDWGRNGDKPTHPELLNWLAVQFVKDGWSLKKLHRRMLLSQTYQQSTHFTPQDVEVDPLNTLLSHMNRLRLEGETLRDSILAVSGRLNPAGGGPGVYPHVSDEVLSTGSTHKWGESSPSDGLRRTVYVFQRRSLVLPIVEAFDGADSSNTCPRRSQTTIAPQALALFNGEFARGEAAFFAARVRKEAGSDPKRQIACAYQVALVRPPTPAQTALALKFLDTQTRLHAHDADGKQAALADLCHVLLNLNEFLYLD